MDAQPDPRSEDESTPEDGLIGALDVVEQQPLDHRAAGFAALHDRLRAELDGAQS